jgi:hypothetical protein
MSVSEQEPQDRSVDRVDERWLECECAALLQTFDRGAEEPEQGFARELRNRLASRYDELHQTDRTNQIGLVVIAPTPAMVQMRRRLTAVLAAAAILIAVITSGLHWSGSGHPGLNEATAEARPTATVAVTLVPETRTS